MGIEGYLSCGEVTHMMRNVTMPKAAQAIGHFLPEGLRRHLRILGSSEQLPRVNFPYVKTELALSDNRQIIFPTEHNYLGVSIIPVAGDEATDKRGIAKMDLENNLFSYGIPEGPYQIMIYAPPPLYYPEQGIIRYYNSYVTVLNGVDDSGMISGVTTAFTTSGGKSTPIQWAVLDQWQEQNAAQKACRLIDGIHIPPLAFGDTQPVLNLHAVNEENEADLSTANALYGSGIVLVQFTHTDIPAGQTPITERNSSMDIFDYFRDNHAAITYKGVGITAFTKRESKRLDFMTNTGATRNVGGPIILKVYASDAPDVAQVEGEMFRHRKTSGRQTVTDVIRKWHHIPQALFIGA